jgi:hypothetical protein
MTIIKRSPQKHGLSIRGKKHPIYKLRERMLYYCYKLPETHLSFPYYRGKGIVMYQEWIDDIMAFYNWCIDNGWKEGMQLDRIDNKGNYEPSNCQFLTKSDHSKKSFRDNERRGETANNVVLNDEKVRIIKALHRLGYPMLRISKLFSVRYSTISSIIYNQSWKHIKE